MLFSACSLKGILPAAIEQREVSTGKSGENTMTTMTLRSNAFGEGEWVPKRYTCDGENLNPPLSIQGIPEGTQSLALIVVDPDSPSGNWVHWLLYNIPPQFDELPENTVPPSSQVGTNDFGNESWGGPCPPPGVEHRYFFKLYALDALLELRRGANQPLLEKAMEGHIIAQTQLIGKYGRGR